MTISENILPQLEFYRALCNFTPDERKFFDLRANGRTLDECCTELGIDDMSTIKRISKRVIKKMETAERFVNMEKWILEHYQ